MALKWEYEIGHYFREREAPRRLFRLVGYNGPNACVMEVNILDEPVEPISQQIPLQGFEHRLEPITKAQFNVNKVFFAASKHQKESKKVNEVEYDEWDNEWKPKK